MSTFKDSTIDYIEFLLLKRYTERLTELPIQCESRGQALTIKTKVYKYAKEVREIKTKQESYDNLYHACNSFSLIIDKNDESLLLIKSRDTLTVNTILKQAVEQASKAEIGLISDGLMTELHEVKNTFYSRD